MINGCWGFGRGGIGHQRPFKVIIQGHVTKMVDSSKHFDQIKFCVSYDGIGHMYPRVWAMDVGGLAAVKWVTMRRSFKVTT